MVSLSFTRMSFCCAILFVYNASKLLLPFTATPATHEVLISHHLSIHKSDTKENQKDEANYTRSIIENKITLKEEDIQADIPLSLAETATTEELVVGNDLFIHSDVYTGNKKDDAKYLRSIVTSTITTAEEDDIQNEIQLLLATNATNEEVVVGNNLSIHSNVSTENQKDDAKEDVRSIITNNITVDDGENQIDITLLLVTAATPESLELGHELSVNPNNNTENQTDKAENAVSILNVTITAEDADKMQTSIIQELFFDRYWPESALPYIGGDIWGEIVDHNRSFFLRPYESGLPSISVIRKWIASKPRPISLVINNHHSKQWPQTNRDNNTEFDGLILEPNLHRMYVLNPYEQDVFANNSKVKPLPLGLQWNALYTNTLYAEPKQQFHDTYSKISKSPSESKALFLSTNRTNTVFIRPMGDTNHRNNNYDRSNDALKTRRSEVPAILNRTAPKSARIVINRLNKKSYFDQLLSHRFVLSPAGNGLDCHGTWEALFCGCIPILPYSSLVPVFENLPVWFVSSWEEVTDELIEKKAQEFLSKVDEYYFEKLFAEYWKHEINNVGCWEEVTDELMEEKAREFLSKVDENYFEKLFADDWKHEINNVGW